MNTKAEGTFAIIVAWTILFSLMWNLIVSAVVSITAWLGFGIYKSVYENWPETQDR